MNFCTNFPYSFDLEKKTKIFFSFFFCLIIIFSLTGCCYCMEIETTDVTVNVVSSQVDTQFF